MPRDARESGRIRGPCPRIHSWLRVGRLALIAAAAAGAAHAQPPVNADPALAPWFQSLQAPNGVSCCSIADCRMTDYRIDATGYEALVDGRWMIVPPDRVLSHVENPTGRAVVCSLPGMGILCFVRPSET
jgi:hypothetical protein